MFNIQAHVIIHGTRKPFEQSVFNQTDDIAKTTGIQLYNTLFNNVDTRENPDPYGIDLLIHNKETNEIIGAAEVEIKLVWEGKFKYKSLHFPERKSKFIAGSTYFTVFDKHLTQCFIVTGETLAKSRLKEVKNYKIKEGEYFFDVPIENCFYYNLNNMFNTNTVQ